jgi:hypothetical protein
MLSDIELNLMRAFYQLLIPGLTPVSLLKSILGFRIVTQREDAIKRPFPISSLRLTQAWNALGLWIKKTVEFSLYSQYVTE